MMYRVAFVLSFVLLLGSTSIELYPQQKPAEPEKEPPPALSVPKEYKYNPRGRRDPFVNPIPPPPPKPKGFELPPVTERPAGLRGIAVNEVNITGLVVGKDPYMTVVTIVGPDNKRYFARVGDILFDAVIRDISINAVRFTETAPGGKGEKVPNPREYVRRFGRTPGENK